MQLSYQQQDTQPYVLPVADLVSVITLKTFLEGKREVMPALISSHIPQLRECQDRMDELLFEVQFSYQRTSDPEPFCHVSPEVLYFFYFLKHHGYAVSRDNKEFVITTPGKEYMNEVLENFCAEQPYTAHVICSALGTDINALLLVAPLESRIKALDPLSGMCIVESGNHDFVVKTEKDACEVFLGNKFVGRVVPGSECSGAIWNSKDCIGEYERCGNIYLISPIKKGRLSAEIVKQHPLDYLLAIA